VALANCYDAEQDQQWQALLAKTGRNDLYLCGSGQKFKNCHGRERTTARNS